MNKYQAPRCEAEEYIINSGAILAGSDLTDDGAGDFLQPGDEYTL